MFKRFVAVLILGSLIAALQAGCSDNVPKIDSNSPASSVKLEKKTPNGPGNPAPKPQ